MLSLMIWICGVSVAADGHWHPSDLAPLSQQFLRLNEGALGPFEDRSRKSSQMATALDNYRSALDILGPLASDDERQRLSDLKTQFGRDQAKVEAFANTLVMDVDETFLSAVERALSKMEGEVQKCAKEIPAGTQVPGLRPRMEPNPDCTGADLNPALAKLLDEDPELLASVDDILSLKWPDVSIPTEPQAAVGTPADWSLVWPLFLKGTPRALRAISDADESARLPFQAALENDPSEEEMQRLLGEAQTLDTETSARRAELAAPILAAANKSLDKASQPVAWCANPKLLGGCTGNDVTSDIVNWLLEDKKVAKALDKAGN